MLSVRYFFFFSSLFHVLNFTITVSIWLCLFNWSFAKCHLALIKFSVYFAGWHALILTSSVLIFCSLACTDSLAFLGHLFKIFFPVFYVLSPACFCCFSFALVASSFFHFSFQLSFAFHTLFILNLLFFFVQIVVSWSSQIAAKSSLHKAFPKAFVNLLFRSVSFWRKK